MEYAIFNIVCSSNGLPIICKPSGYPFLSSPAGIEIPGDQEYVVWNNVLVADVHNGLICLDAEGEFYNPYIQRTMTVDLKLENYPIGLDIDATPYGYLLN